MGILRRPALAFLAAAALCACSDIAPPRPQILLVLDTDLPLVGQLSGLPAASHDAAIDTLRVDAIDADGKVFDYRILTVPDARDWPVSMGVTGRVRLRIRAFRAMRASPEQVQGSAALAPPVALAVDRLVDLEPDPSSVKALRVLLTGDCLGVPPGFLAPARTCVDAAHREASPSDALQPVDGARLPASEAGSWEGARERACTVAAGDGRVCVPGGFSILGEPALSGVMDYSTLDSVPLRPVRISPFLIDTAEFTVGRFRALVQQGLIDQGLFPLLPGAPGTADAWCAWRGVEDGVNDALPLNCVTAQAARKACEVAGGSLPTEAQWEHAARGRGQGRSYPWGGEPTRCCASSVSRFSVAGVPVECEGSGPEPVGSHLRSESCGGLGDVSRDGVLDLGGSVGELVRDKFRRFDDPCWTSTGVPLDPVCEDDTATTFVSRGGNWSAGRGNALSAFRFSFQVGPGNGFRCVYPGGGS